LIGWWWKPLKGVLYSGPRAAARAASNRHAMTQAQTQIQSAMQGGQPQPVQPPSYPTQPASQNYYVPPRSERVAAQPPGMASQAVGAPAPSDDLMTQLAKLVEMKQAGQLSDDEFAAAKAKLLGTV
jgi:hypothetical protein